MEWQLQQQTVEVRYKRGFLHWDRAGALTNDICQKFPSFTFEKFENNGGIVLTDEVAQYRFAFGAMFSSFTAIAAAPKEDEITATASDLVSRVMASYDVNLLTRVGHRVDFHLPLESQEAARKRFEKLTLKHGAGASFLQSTGDDRLMGKTLKDFTLRFEDDKTGVRIVSQIIKPERNFSGPNIHEITSRFPPTQWAIAVNVDVFTVQPLPAADLFVEVLMKSNLKMLRTRILPLLT